MSDEFRIADELNPVEHAFSELKPRASRMDRDRLMYLAGQAAAEAETPLVPAPPRRNVVWPIATVFSTAAAIVFAVMFFTSRSTVSQPGVQYVTVPQPLQTPALPQQKSHGDKPDVRQLVGEMPAMMGGPLRTESAMVRSRYPILATDVERLPATRSTGNGGGSSPVTLHDMRLSLLAKEKDESPKQPTGLRLFQWTWPSSQGDRL